MIKNHKYRAKKSLGQNFLVDKNYQHKIIKAIQKDYQGQVVVEIGPGKGAITNHLKDFASKIILVEKDRALAEKLKITYQDNSKIEIVCADFLKWSEPDLKNVIVVGNLPYNVSSQILIKLLKAPVGIYDQLFLMFQKEVGLRCVANPGSKDYGVLSLWSQIFCNVDLLFHLPPTAFSPRPKVKSSFLCFNLLKQSYDEQALFINFVKKIFGQRRKKISTILKKHDAIKKIDDHILSLIDQRAEALSLKELKQVFLAFS